MPNSYSSLATFPLFYPPAVPCDTFHMVELLVMLRKSLDIIAENIFCLTTIFDLFPLHFSLTLAGKNFDS